MWPIMLLVGPLSRVSATGEVLDNADFGRQTVSQALGQLLQLNSIDGMMFRNWLLPLPENAYGNQEPIRRYLSRSYTSVPQPTSRFKSSRFIHRWPPFQAPSLVRTASRP